MRSLTSRLCPYVLVGHVVRCGPPSDMSPTDLGVGPRVSSPFTSRIHRFGRLDNRVNIARNTTMQHTGHRILYNTVPFFLHLRSLQDALRRWQQSSAIPRVLTRSPRHGSWRIRQSRRSSTATQLHRNASVVHRHVSQQRGTHLPRHTSRISSRSSARTRGTAPHVSNHPPSPAHMP